MQALLSRALGDIQSTHTHGGTRLGVEVEVRVQKKQKKVLISMSSGRPLGQVDDNA